MEINKRQILMNTEMKDIYLQFEEGRGREMNETEMDFFIQSLETSQAAARRPYNWLRKLVEASQNIKAELQLSDFNVDGYYICLYVFLFEMEKFYQTQLDTFDIPDFDYPSTPIGKLIVDLVDLCRQFKDCFSSSELIYVEISRHIGGHLNPTGFEIDIKKPNGGDVYLDRGYKLKSTGKVADALEIDEIIRKLESKYGDRSAVALNFESRTREIIGKFYLKLDPIFGTK